MGENEEDDEGLFLPIRLRGARTWPPARSAGPMLTTGGREPKALRFSAQRRPPLSRRAAFFLWPASECSCPRGVSTAFDWLVRTTHARMQSSKLGADAARCVEAAGGYMEDAVDEALKRPLQFSVVIG